MNGQERRAWLDRQGQNALDALSYYLGPGVPVNALAQLGDMFNPVSDIGRAGTAMRGVVRPGASVSERVNALGNVATDMASVLAPVGGAAYADDAARGLSEALANWSMPADDAVGRLIADESGAIRAWHGSPHDFDRFSMDKIGTGEGAQAYGHGLYFAEKRGIAESYRDALRKSTINNRQPDWDNPNDVASYWAEIYGGTDGALKYLRGVQRNSTDPVVPAAIEVLERGDALGKPIWDPGRLYEVNIDANPEDFLDWDAPLSAQPPQVRDALSGFPDEMMGGDAVRAYSGFVGERAKADNDILQHFPGAWSKAASEELNRAGVAGVRYLDAGSRGAGDGSRNYVVFDDSLISILNKYGLAGMMAGGAYSMAPEEQY